MPWKNPTRRRNGLTGRFIGTIAIERKVNRAEKRIEKPRGKESIVDERDKKKIDPEKVEDNEIKENNKRRDEEQRERKRGS